MKQVLVLSSLLVYFPSFLSAQLSDDFSGTGIDTNKWNVVLPFTNRVIWDWRSHNVTSAASQANGDLLLNGGAFVTSRQRFTSPYMYSGTFNQTSIAGGRTMVSLRGDGTSFDPSYGGPNGNILLFFFGDPNNTPNYKVEISQSTTTNPYFYETVAETYRNNNFPLSMDSPTAFSIADYGTNVEVTINNVLVSRAVVRTDNFGGHVSIASQWSDHGALKVDNIQVQSLAVDTDGDGIPDAYETNTGVYASPNDTGTDPNNPDTDGDGLKDGAEYLLADLGFNPLTKDPARVLSLFSNPNNASLFTQTQYDANRTNGQNDVATNPAAFNLFTQTQHDSNRTNGQTDVTSNPSAFNLFTESQRATFGAEQFSNGVSSVISTMPSLQVSAPDTTFLRVGVGSNNETSMSVSNLPVGWKYDPLSRHIFGRLTNSFTTQLIAQNGSNAPVPLTFNFYPQRRQVISPFKAISAKTFANPAPSFPVTSPTSNMTNLSVSVSVKSGPATIIENTVTLTGAGRVILAANQDGNATTTPAAEVTTAFNVSKGSQTIKFGQLATEQFVPGKSISLSAFASSGLPVSYQSNRTNVVRIEGNNAIITGRGTATITARQGGNANWNAAPAVARQIVVF